MTEKISIRITEDERVTGLIYFAAPRKRRRVTLLLGHGAGANQQSDFMRRFASELALRGLDVVTFNFLYTEQGRRAPDRNDKLESCYRAAIDTAVTHKKLRSNRLMIGGKSMGGRIASQVAASGVAVSGLIFLGYPLHPPGKPGEKRDAHLSLIRSPMLFLQGERDPFGRPEEIARVAKRFELDAEIYRVEGGDHSFAVLKRSALGQEEVFRLAQDEIARWVDGVVRKEKGSET
ncbi:MAG: alpha/beta fold hydrolase [Acidobacteriota bacterium]